MHKSTLQAYKVRLSFCNIAEITIKPYRAARSIFGKNPFRPACLVVVLVHKAYVKLFIYIFKQYVKKCVIVHSRYFLS